MEKKANIVLTITGMLFICISLFTLTHLLYVVAISESLNPRWFISLTFVIGCFILGIWLRIMSCSDNNILLTNISYLYTVAALIVASYMGYRQSFTKINVQEFFSFLLIFGISLGISKICIKDNLPASNIMSYGYLHLNLLYILLLIYKYIFQEASFYFEVFTGEIVILTITTFCFVLMYHHVSVNVDNGNEKDENSTNFDFSELVENCIRFINGVVAEEKTNTSVEECITHGLTVTNENDFCILCVFEEELNDIKIDSSLSNEELQELANECQKIRDQLMKIRYEDFIPEVAEAYSRTQKKAIEIADLKIAEILDFIEVSGVDCPEHGYFETMHEDKGCLICSLQDLYENVDYASMGIKELQETKAGYAESLRRMDIRKDLERKRPNCSDEKLDIMAIQEEIIKEEIKKAERKIKDYQNSSLSKKKAKQQRYTHEVLTDSFIKRLNKLCEEIHTASQQFENDPLVVIPNLYSLSEKYTSKEQNQITKIIIC